MNRVMKLIGVTFAAIALVGFGKSSLSAAADEKLTIAVIPKGTTHSYWKSVKAGAEAAGKELGVNIIYKGPLKEDDRAQQISVVEQFVSDNVSGIVLAPLDEAALVRPVREAAGQKIPVVIIDSALKATAGTDFVSFIATNNRQGGNIAGDQMAKILGGKGKLVLLRYAEGSASTEEREAGFLESIKKNPDMSMLVDNRYGGATVSEAETASLNLLDQIKQADGIFCPNESSTMGMLLALRQNNLAGKVHFVGFDASAPLIAALKAGEIDALVAQNPTKMGYLGVKTCVSAIRGETVPQSIDSGVQLITRDNLNDPEVQKLLGGG
jgi:ribose transport system substrate-binding protein